MNKIIKIYQAIIVIIVITILTGCEKEKEKVPVITTTAVSNITATTATSGGNITDEGSSTVTSRGVCWSTSTEPKISDSKTSNGAGAGSFSSDMTDLFGGTTYYVRAYAANKAGTGYGMALSFTTSGQPPSKPSVTILYPTNIQTSSAELNGRVNANYYSTVVTFEYGTTTNYGSTITATQSPVIGGTDINVSANISGLAVGTIYHIRIKAVNSLGSTYSNDLTLPTLGKIPAVSTKAATNITLVSGQLNGTVNANYLSTTVTFEYGTTTNYGGTITATQSPVTGNADVNVSANLTGLTTGTTCHFRLKAVNSLGTATGGDMTFTPDYIIRGNLNGNIIFYIDGTGQHGLVCAPTDQKTGVTWGCYGTTIIGANGTAVGTGNQNTIDIVNGCSTTGIAARICYDLVLNGYDDWYLPSKDELNLMYNNLQVTYLPEFSETGYWSSSQSNSTEAWWQWFGFNSSDPQDANKKDHPANIRAIRAF